MNKERCKVALAIEAKDENIFADEIAKLQPDKQFYINTAKDTVYTKDTDLKYCVYYWDRIIWGGETVERLLKKLENRGHALYTISEDDELWKDVDTLGGAIDEFAALFEFDARIKFKGQTDSYLDEITVKGYDLLTVDLSNYGDEDEPFSISVEIQVYNVGADFELFENEEDIIAFLEKNAMLIKNSTKLQFIIDSDEEKYCMNAAKKIKTCFERLRGENAM